MEEGFAVGSLLGIVVGKLVGSFDWNFVGTDVEGTVVGEGEGYDVLIVGENVGAFGIAAHCAPFET